MYMCVCIYMYIYVYIYMYIYILGVVKRNPLFFHSILCKNNGFLFTTPNTYIHTYIYYRSHVKNNSCC